MEVSSSVQIFVCRPPVQDHVGLETLAKIASSMEGEIQVEIHHDEVTSPVREKGASSKKL